jgi:flagellar biosynthesis chaperone FliJ
MAGGFVFRLQPLLDERKRVERAKQHAFALAAQALEKSSRELDRLALALRSGGYALHDCARYGSTAGLRTHDAHLRYLERLVASHEARNAESALALELAVQELHRANLGRRLVERLRERRLHEFEREEARRDELELQEANARRRERRLQ